jgi:formate dehydrogenase subunit gamma
MSHEYLPLSLRKQLREKQIRKHNLANILTHWFNVLAWLLLLPTGLGILSSPRLGIVPQVWIDATRNTLGGLANLVEFHYTIGILWLCVLSFNIFVGFRKYFLSFASERLLLDKDDIDWLKLKPLQMVGLAKDKPLPPQDAYNAGQKVYSYVVIGGIFLIGLSGLIMTFSRFIPWKWLVQWALPVHFGAVGAVFAGVIVHVYMGAVFPEERSAFFSMFTGNVNALYARLHHSKWYWRKVEAEQAWEESVLAESWRPGASPLAETAALDTPAAEARAGTD